MFDAILYGPKFKSEPLAMTALSVVGWWESRRFFYNVVVGCAGLASCVLVAICAVVSDMTLRESVDLPLPDGALLGVFAVIAYGIFANIVYTAGWIFELIVRALSTRERSAAYALKTFRFGVQFSVVLTFLPAAICWISFAVALTTG